jgi:DNA-binding transcriptional LysR family regulator
MRSAEPLCQSDVVIYLIQMIDIRALDPTLLLTFRALLTERSVSRAARRVGLSQPATSGVLARLRMIFDDPLFVRTQRGVLPTARALELGPRVERALTELRGLLEPAAFDPERAKGQIWMAATDYAQGALLPLVVRELRRRAPDVQLGFRPLTGLPLAEQFAHGALDFALVTSGAVPPDFRARIVTTDRLLVVARLKHPLERQLMTLDGFCSADHLVIAVARGAFEGVADRALAARERSRRVRVATASFHAALTLIEATDLVGMLPSRLVEALRDRYLVLEPPLPIPSFELALVWHRRSDEDLLHKWVRELVAAQHGRS